LENRPRTAATHAPAARVPTRTCRSALFGFSYIAFAFDTYESMLPVVERLAGS
jgi:hypothetical protein